MNKYVENLKIDLAIKRELVKENKYKGETRKCLEELLRKHKREFRDWLKRQESNGYLYKEKKYGKIITGGGDFDGLWRKVFFPNEHWDDEDIEFFKKDNWIEYVPSPYDCTGQIFTWAIDVFNVPNGVIAFIRDAIDV